MQRNILPTIRFAAGVGILACFVSGCSTDHVAAGIQSASAKIRLTPSAVTLMAGSSQQFAATVTRAGSTGVDWSVSAPITGNDSAGTITAAGLYTAPANLGGKIEVQVTATSVADSRVSASATVDVSPMPSITVSPAAANVAAGARQAFSASLSDSSLGSVEWQVNGFAGGSRSMGTITVAGIYTAPGIDPGIPITIAAMGSLPGSVSGAATVTVVNPPRRELTGITYRKLLSSWDNTQLPRIAQLAGLKWDPESRTWNPVADWTAPISNLAPQIYYLYTSLDPMVEMAIARQDVSLMEELAAFHLALLRERTLTIGAILQAAPAGAYIFIDGAAGDRTFGYETMYSATRTQVTECQLCNARYLLSAARLLRAVAQLPFSERTPPLIEFATSFSSFITNEQLIRMLYGTTPWSHWNNPNIPQPLVSGWIYLGETGYRPSHPITYQGAMTDAELWILAATAELLGADAASPDLNILDSKSRALLIQATSAGTALLERRTRHVAAPDGTDTLSTLAGDYDDDPDLAYSGYDGLTVPAAPKTKYGLMADSMHSSILPPVYQSLYENREATGNNFPALNDVVSLGNTYVHLAFNGDARLPDFNNYLDGWNGWFRVGYPDLPAGYPPHQYCDAQRNPGNCMAAGTMQGWGHLALFNPDLATLEQDLIAMANDDSAARETFKAQHYWYNSRFSANDTDYPDLLVYIGGDTARLIP